MSSALHPGAHRVPMLATAILCLTLLQGTSTTLTLAYHFKAGLHVFEPLLSLLWILTYAAAALGLVMSFGINWISWMVRYRLLLTLLLIGTALSAAWSMDASLTFERTVHLFGSTLIALYIGFMLPLDRILRISGWIFGGLLGASLLVALLYPSLGIENYEGQLVWRGIMTSKNTLGFWSAVSVMLFASLLHQSVSNGSRMLWGALVLLALIILAFTVSATSWLALMSGAMVMSFLFVSGRFQLGFVATAVLGLLLASIAALAFYNINTAELIGRSGDLTGRGEVWSQTWKLILDKPLTGYGYGVLWYPTEASIWIQQTYLEFTWTVYHAHNGFLQLASEIGLPLTMLAVLMIVQQLIEIVYCQYHRQHPGVLFVLGFTVALLASNYSEARMLVNRELYWIFFIALPVSMLQQVTVVVGEAGFNPMPAPLPPRTREKLVSMVPERQQRQRLKARLRRRLISTETESGTRFEVSQPRLEGRSRRQRNKTG